MVYSISGNKAIINGQNGIYDKKVNNPEAKYGRNACDNYLSYTKDLARSYETPIQFAYQYIPDGQYSKVALMGNAYEELGKRTEVSLKELNAKMEESNKILGTNLTADALDLNGDGKVDIAEYATSTMAADMLDENPYQCQIKNLDGKITNVGEAASQQLYDKNNVQNAKQLFTEIHKTFDLNSAMNEFKADPNNL